MSFEAYQTAADYVRAQAGDAFSGQAPKVAIILGSGLNSFADSVEGAVAIAYSDIPGFPKPLVEGHAGRMLIGTLAGVPVICMQGRVHGYEGHADQALAFHTRTLWALGVETLVLTNAAGSLNEAAGPGSLMLITDHINFSGVNPLVGLNDARIGPRFNDMTHAWNPALSDAMRAAAKGLGITLHEGTYLMAKGPNFETPAEIRAFRTMGADAVGMSTVPECLAANHAGMRVTGISSITNLAAGMTGNALTHDETMEFGALAAVNLTKLLTAFVASQG